MTRNKRIFLIVAMILASLRLSLAQPSPETQRLQEKRTIVRAGETLWKVSKRVYGNGFYWPLLAWKNRLPGIHSIYPGQILVYELGYPHAVIATAVNYAKKYEMKNQKGN